MSVLKRRSIRTKLIGALALLSAVVLFLSVSGFWGLHRYRQASEEMVLRSNQLLIAGRLNDSAEELLDIHTRILAILSEEGLIESSIRPGKTKLDFERDAWFFELGAFQNALDRYDSLSLETPGHEDALSRALNEEPSMASLRHRFNGLKPFGERSFPAVYSQRVPLSFPLDQLVVATEGHQSVLQSDLNDLTHKLRGHYRTWTTFAWIGTTSALSLVGILLWSLNSLVVKPFRTLLDGSRLVAGGQFDHRIDLGTGDELSELAVAMNEMTDRFQGAFSTVNSLCADLDRQVQERTREVIQNEQLASVGFLAAGVAHEINNPLATIAWSAESLESRVSELNMLPSGERKIDDELLKCLTENLRRIEEEAYRCKGITEKLLDFSRLSEVRRAPTNLFELVNDVVSMVGKVGKYRCKTISVRGNDSVFAHVNPQEIRQVVLNLVTNALESLSTDGSVEIVLKSDGTKASVAISDNGCGMSEEVLKHVFEPFFTRRRDGTGTGLGLSITYRIVSQHGGSLTAKSDGEGCGSKMELTLPVEPECGDDVQNRSTIGLTYEPSNAA